MSQYNLSEGERIIWKRIYNCLFPNGSHKNQKFTQLIETMRSEKIKNIAYTIFCKETEIDCDFWIEIYGSRDNYLIASGEKFSGVLSSEQLELAVLNNRFDLVSQNNIDSNHTKLLYNCCDDASYENIYFYLREKNVTPNLSVFNRASEGNSYKILNDISELIDLTPKNMERIVISNHTEIVKYFLKKVENFDKNLSTYPILNGNSEIIQIMEEMGFINWHNQLFYTALLSGSREMVDLVEKKIPNIHKDHILDTGHTKKGKISSILREILYYKGKKPYFSHTIGYAIQSNNLDMVKYCFQLGYKITVSNMITSIQKSSLEILEYLCQNSDFILPHYVFHYFGPYSHVTDKIEKFKILSNYKKIDFEKQKMVKKELASYYNLETTHYQMIVNQREICDDQIDVDYLLQLPKLFNINDKIAHLQFTKLRLSLILGLEKYIKLTDSFASDCLAYYGNVDQIKFYSQKFHFNPSQKILTELSCYGRIDILHVINECRLK